jgi:hypothetical protein
MTHPNLPPPPDFPWSAALSSAICPAPDVCARKLNWDSARAVILVKQSATDIADLED